MYYHIVWYDGTISRWPASMFTEEYLAGLKTIASFEIGS